MCHEEVVMLIEKAEAKVKLPIERYTVNCVVNQGTLLINAIIGLIGIFRELLIKDLDSLTMVLRHTLKHIWLLLVIVMEST